MNYTKKSFSVGAPGTDTYRENYDRTFRSADPQPALQPCAKCGTLRVDGLKCTTCGHENKDSNAGPRESDFPAVMELRQAADRQWARGNKSDADQLHREAAELFRKLTEGSP